jgi:hypothetical protein
MSRLLFVFAAVCVLGAMASSSVCSLAADAGSCSKGSTAQPSVQWFYNATVNACYQFVYSGCSGNDNRFSTSALCVAACRVEVSVGGSACSPLFVDSPDSSCAKGAKVTRYSFDSSVGTVVKVTYTTGCATSANLYATFDAAMKACPTSCLQQQQQQCALCSVITKSCPAASNKQKSFTCVNNKCASPCNYYYLLADGTYMTQEECDA